jgi:hypothetical protein
MILVIIAAIIFYMTYWSKRPVETEPVPPPASSDVPAVSPAAPPAAETPADVAAAPAKLEIEESVATGEVKNNAGEVVFRFSVVLPKAKPEGSAAAAKINEYYAKVMKDADSYVEQTGELAKNDSAAPNFVSPYSYSQTFEVEYSDEKTLSVRRVMYSDFGGAHGLTTVSFDVFNPKTGDQLTLGNYFAADQETYLTKLMSLVSEQIKKAGNSPKTGWETDPKKLAAAFNEKDFCATDDGLILVFQPYSITSYSEGIPEFKIPFTDLTGLLNR